MGHHSFVLAVRWLIDRKKKNEKTICKGLRTDLRDVRIDDVISVRCALSAELTNNRRSVSKMAEEDVFLAATSNALWDPVHSKDWDKEKVTPQCVLRIKR